MGCFQTHEIEDDNICDIQEKVSNSSTFTEAGIEMDKPLSGLIEINDEETKVSNKPSEILALTPENIAELLKTRKRV